MSSKINCDAETRSKNRGSKTDMNFIEHADSRAVQDQNSRSRLQQDFFKISDTGPDQDC